MYFKINVCAYSTFWMYTLQLLDYFDYRCHKLIVHVHILLWWKIDYFWPAMWNEDTVVCGIYLTCLCWHMWHYRRCKLLYSERFISTFVLSIGLLTANENKSLITNQPLKRVHEYIAQLHWDPRNLKVSGFGAQSYSS